MNIVAIYAVILFGVGLILYGGFLSQQSNTISLKRDDLIVPKKGVDFSKLFPSRKLLERTGLFFSIKKNIDFAHVHMSPEAFFNIKVIIMIILGLATFFLAGKFDLIFILIALVLGYLLPDLYLKNIIAKRKRQIVRRLPETIDLLGLCIEAGLDFTNSVKWVIDKTPGNAMLEELAFVVEEIKWGKPKVQALKDMSRRLDIPEISSFVQTIIQAERMGSPVSEAFTILSEDARAQRFHNGERIALKAPIKILIPLIFCIMPVIGIIIGGPILLEFMTGGLLSGIK